MRIRDVAEKLVDEIILDLCTHDGLGEEWSRIESDIRLDIRSEWVKIAEKRISSAGTEVP